MRLKLRIKVLVLDGESPFVYWVRGSATIQDLEEIERELSTDEDGVLDKGSGEYLIQAIFYSPQVGEFGIEVDAHFELEVLQFTSFPK